MSRAQQGKSQVGAFAALLQRLDGDDFDVNRLELRLQLALR